VLGPGSAGLVANLHDARVPTYVTLTTNKLSFWEEHTEPAFRELRQKEYDGGPLRKEVFSHDVVPLDLFTAVITEYEILPPPQMRETYERLRQQFFEDEARLRALHASLPGGSRDG